MENSVIVLDSSDDENETKKDTKQTNILRESLEFGGAKQTKDPLEPVQIDDNLNTKTASSIIADQSKKRNAEPSRRPVKRIKPTTITKEINKKSAFFDDDYDEPKSHESTTKDEADDPKSNVDDQEDEDEENPKTPITAAFAALLDACKYADPSTDMEVLIKKKLIRYYEMVHPDFVNSRSFSKTALAIAEDIRINPNLVYLKVSGILEELNIRRKSGQTVMSNEEITSTGNARRDYQIKRLNHALYILKKKIAKLDEAEVDLNDDDNSNYLLVERYKKRACEIYEKICDITGESKHAHRQVRKPILFKGTGYPEFNKTIQAFVNRTKTFPDMFDVLRCLEHCNNQYGFKLSKDQIKSIAQDAFIKIGRSLQKRRKTDLYETVSYFAGTENDPAEADTILQSKLTENQKYHLRINEIIDQYAAVQDKSLTKSCMDDTKNEEDNTEEKDKENHNSDVNANNATSASVQYIDDSDEDDEEEEDESMEGDENTDTTNHRHAANKTNSTENSTDLLAIQDNEIVISDDEELILS